MNAMKFCYDVSIERYYKIPLFVGGSFSLYNVILIIYKVFSIVSRIEYLGYCFNDGLSNSIP